MKYVITFLAVLAMYLITVLLGGCTRGAIRGYDESILLERMRAMEMRQNYLEIKILELENDGY